MFKKFLNSKIFSTTVIVMFFATLFLSVFVVKSNANDPNDNQSEAAEEVVEKSNVYDLDSAVENLIGIWEVYAMPDDGEEYGEVSAHMRITRDEKNDKNLVLRYKADFLMNLDTKYDTKSSYKWINVEDIDYIDNFNTVRAKFTERNNLSSLFYLDLNNRYRDIAFSGKDNDRFVMFLKYDSMTYTVYGHKLTENPNVPYSIQSYQDLKLREVMKKVIFNQ